MADWLSKLRAPVGSRKEAIRKGRGLGSGIGKTAGKGQKGQKARHPGNFGKLAFQGGQTPIQRRLPKRGFHPPFPVETELVNVSSLVRCFEKGATVDHDTLVKAGLVNSSATRIKVLGNGDIDRALTIKVHAVSAGARTKIEKAGGTIELLETPRPPKPARPTKPTKKEAAAAAAG